MSKLKCPARTRPRPPGGTRVMPRDKLILLLVARCAPVTTTQVRTYLECSTDVAQRRCRVLRDHGLLQVTLDPRGLHRPNLLTLGLPAMPVLDQTFGLSPEQCRRPKAMPRNLDHHLGVVDLYIQLKAATTRSKRIDLADSMLDWELRQGPGARQRRVQVPDLVAVLQSDSGRMGLAIEVDMATQSPDSVVRNKALPYAQARLSGSTLKGCRDWAVLMVSASVRRRNRLMIRLGREALPLGLFYFAVSENISARSFLGRTTWRARHLGSDGVVRWPETDPFAPIRTTRQVRADGFRAPSKPLQAANGAPANSDLGPPGGPRT